MHFCTHFSRRRGQDFGKCPTRRCAVKNTCGPQLARSSKPSFDPFTQSQAHNEVGEAITCPHLYSVISW